MKGVVKGFTAYDRTHASRRVKGRRLAVVDLGDGVTVRYPVARLRKVKGLLG